VHRARDIGTLVVAFLASIIGGTGCDDAGGAADPSGTIVQSSSSTVSDTATTGGKSGTKTGFIRGKDGVMNWAGPLIGGHVKKPVKYPMDPPVGGRHHPTPLNCNGDVYTKPVRNENAVHSLEHGAVWVTYTSRAAKADIKVLAARVRRTPYSMMSPYGRQKQPIMLSAWGVQRAVKGAKDPNVAKFFEKYVQGEQTPEPGAPCTGGTME